MKRHLGRLFMSIVALISLMTALVASAAAAVTSVGGNGLRVSPVVSDLTINPGQSQTVTVSVQNVTGAPATFQVLINDFTATDESGTPSLLLNGQDAPSHSLKQFVAPVDSITVQPGEEKSVPVTITIPKGTPGGGYYGAVRFAPASSSGSTSNVTLAASVGSLILVRVPGDFKEDLRLISFDVLPDAAGSPRVVFTAGKGLTVAARFENQGDVQEQPFGKILLEQGNKEIATYELNNTTPRGNVLPDSIRKFTVTLDKVGSFGKYTVVGNFGYGTNGQLLSGKTTFYVVPVWDILAAVVVLLVILFFIFGFPRLMRVYNQRVIRNARR